MATMKSLVVAMDRRGAIGFDGDLPWGRSLKDDLANFRRLTTDASVIMGRKTFESIGSKPLPKRENIVVSHSPTGVDGVLTAADLESAYALARYPVCIIGGAQIYAQSLGDMDRLYVTHVDAKFADASVYFPDIDWSLWEEVSRDHYDADDRNAYPFDIVAYEKSPKE
jgi:dihydrofolate reductase